MLTLFAGLSIIKDNPGVSKLKNMGSFNGDVYLVYKRCDTVGYVDDTSTNISLYLHNGNSCTPYSIFTERDLSSNDWYVV